MFKINTSIKLIKYIVGYILIWLGIFAINNLGVAKMIFGENIANKFFYPAFSLVIQWTTIVFLVVLPGLIIYSIINFVRNRGKPDEPSVELQAIIRLETNLSTKLDRLIEIMGDRKNETTKIE